MIHVRGDGELVKSVDLGAPAASLGIDGRNSRPDISPDGRTLLHVTSWVDDGRAILSDLDGGDRRPAQRGPSGTIACARWFDRGTDILLTAPRDDGSWELRTLDADGGSTQVLVPIDEIDSACGDPVPSGGGTALVIYRDDLEDGEIWQVDVDGGHPRLVLEMTGCSGGEPAVAPDGRTVAVPASCEAAEETGIWLVDLATGERRILTDNRNLGPDEEPVRFGPVNWSHDGRWVVHGRSATTDNEDIAIWISSTDGATRRELVEAPSSWPVLVPRTPS